MANDKLQELTRRLYDEGLSKGKQEGENIIAQARAEAEKTIADARLQAEQILAEAQKKADDLVAKTTSDLKMASSQAIDATKADILNSILAKVADKNVGAVLDGEEFTKEVIMIVAKNFGKEVNCELEMVLPDTVKGKLDDFIAKEVTKAVGNGIELSFSKKIKGGFQIGPKNGGYFISFSDETFSALIREYLRPATSKLLFGE